VHDGYPVNKTNATDAHFKEKDDKEEEEEKAKKKRLENFGSNATSSTNTT
jgi:hypothetical protein